MDKTAIGAATRGTEQEICKVRVQSTPEEISHFHELLDKCEELGLCNVLNFSDMFANKGTAKYYRAYSDIEIRREDENE